MPISPHRIDQPDPAWEAPDAFDRLGQGDQLVVWTVRAIAIGHGDCPALRRLFMLAFGRGADDAFMGFLITVRTLGISGRRRLRLHAPGCLGVSADECALLALFAAAQAALVSGNDGEVCDQLAHLAEPPAWPTLLLSLQAAASALELSGYALTASSMELSTRKLAATAAWTLH